MIFWNLLKFLYHTSSFDLTFEYSGFSVLYLKMFCNIFGSLIIDSTHNILMIKLFY
jgi:hypothetical protein